MRILKLAVLLAAFHACSADDYDPLSYTDRQCGSNIANLWLDIVAVIDNSYGMTDNGLISITADLQSLFSMGTRIGYDPNEPRTTRLAVVTYNSVATIKADLNKYQSLDDLYNVMPDDIMPASSTTTSYLETGLSAAEKVFENGTQDGLNRTNYKQVVIVYASSYSRNGDDDPVPVATRLKTNGNKIITIAYDQKGDGSLLQELSVIASPRFNFSNSVDGSSIITEATNALLESNCFCPNDWFQYRDNYGDDYAKPYGICLQPVNLAATWRSAQGACKQKSPNGYLASEFNPTKHNYIFGLVQNTKGFSSPYKYHIGLFYNTTDWTWDQPKGMASPVLQNWNNWLQNYPQNSAAMSGGRNIQSGLRTVWQNIPTMNGQNGANNYICERYSCDTENYCASTK